ncbi:hypothetical protein BASA61_008992 [Batrachochytrium salamandrivorans]|nr:hypothetical protein BASA62_000864 [Batrachochytrium salamandrivorans]KAH6581573.1 hypothetical protein BASA61_008992 [Batrachochytrium salamandrivorans]KAH9270804.1 hypothetical protein BASA83_006955 [Batrachochytrium salamandrivorans]
MDRNKNSINAITDKANSTINPTSPTWAQELMRLVSTEPEQFTTTMTSSPSQSLRLREVREVRLVPTTTTTTAKAYCGNPGAAALSAATTTIDCSTSNSNGSMCDSHDIDTLSSGLDPSVHTAARVSMGPLSMPAPSSVLLSPPVTLQRPHPTCPTSTPPPPPSSQSIVVLPFQSPKPIPQESMSVRNSTATGTTLTTDAIGNSKTDVPPSSVPLFPLVTDPVFYRITTPPMPLDWSWVQVRRRGTGGNGSSSVHGDGGDIDCSASRYSESESDSIELISVPGEAMSPVAAPLMTTSDTVLSTLQHQIPSTQQQQQQQQQQHQQQQQQHQQQQHQQHHHRILHPLSSLQCPSKQHPTKHTLQQSPIMNPAFLDAFRSQPDHELMAAPQCPGTYPSAFSSSVIPTVAMFSSQFTAMESISHASHAIQKHSSIMGAATTSTPSSSAVHGSVPLAGFNGKRELNYGGLLGHPAIARTATSTSMTSEPFLRGHSGGGGDSTLGSFVCMERTSSKGSFRSVHSINADFGDSPVLVPNPSMQAVLSSSTVADGPPPFAFDPLHLPTRSQAAAGADPLPLKEDTVGISACDTSEKSGLLKHLYGIDSGQLPSYTTFDICWPMSQIMDGDPAADSDSWPWFLFKLVSTLVAAGVGGFLAFKCAMMVQRMVVDRIARLAH